MMGAINSYEEDLKSYVLEKVEARRDQMIEASDAIWDYAKIALLEFKSSKLLADIAEKEGFVVERGVADLETAFVAVYGSIPLFTFRQHVLRLKSRDTAGLLLYRVNILLDTRGCFWRQKFLQQQLLIYLRIQKY